MSRFFRSDFARHGLLVFTAGTFVNVVSYVFNFVLSRWFGVSGYGILSSMTAAVVLAMIPAGILTTVVVKHAAELHAVRDDPRLAMLTRQTFRAAATAAMLALASVLIARHAIADYLKIVDLRLIGGTGGILAIAMAVTMLRGLLQGTQRFRTFALSIVLEGGLRGTLAILFVAFGFGVVGSIAGWLLAELLALVYIVLSLPKPVDRYIQDNEVRLNWSRLAHTSGAVGLSAMATTALGFSDMVLVKHFMNAHAAGLYGALSLSGKVLTFGLGFMPAILLPKATAHAMRGESALTIFVTAGVFSAVVFGGFLILVAFASAHVLAILVGPTYSDAAPFVFRYCVSAALLSLTLLVTTYKTALHRFDFVVPVSVAAAAEIGAIYMFHRTIGDVVTIVLAGNFAALLGSSWRISTPLSSANLVASNPA